MAPNLMFHLVLNEVNMLLPAFCVKGSSISSMDLKYTSSCEPAWSALRGVGSVFGGWLAASAKVESVPCPQNDEALGGAQKPKQEPRAPTCLTLNREFTNSSKPQVFLLQAPSPTLKAPSLKAPGPQEDLSKSLATSTEILFC